MAKPGEHHNPGSFIDTAHVYLKAGDGGNGAASFRREKYIPYGGPDGGNGGQGGSIWFEASNNITTLAEVASHPHITVDNASPGGGNRCDGLKSKDKTIYVPCGTVVKRDGVVLCDLKDHGQRYLAAKGGRGGRGNLAFKTKFNTAPKISENGEPGEKLEAWLELSVLADVGLVGFPNAGKSTLLSVVSAARPKIAAYPFTTLNPNIGMVHHKKTRFAMADIPGLIEGAHQGRGLGDLFLKHVLRTKLLLHLVDPQGFNGIKPEKAVRVIEKELKEYHPKMARKKSLLVVTKADLPEAQETFKLLKKKFPKREVFLLSSVSQNGLAPLLDRVIQLLPEIRQQDLFQAAEGARRKGELPEKRGFAIARSRDGALVVTGVNIERLVAMTNFSQADSWDRLRRVFSLIGLDKGLRKAGASEGSTVRIGEMEFQWSDAVKPAGRKSKFAYKYRVKDPDLGHLS